MRQRKIRNLQEKIDDLAAYRITDPAAMRGNWQALFENEAPLFLEIGCGKGKFAAGLAELHTEYNYVAIEGQESVALRALEKARAVEKKTGRRNLYVALAFTNALEDFFAAGELSGIYLNFSDPWPKERHGKRRLTYRGRLSGYLAVLADGGFIEIRTDNDGLYAFTLREIAAVQETMQAQAAQGSAAFNGAGERQTAQDGKGALLVVTACEADAPPAPVMSEYEEKFRAQGLPIYFIRIEKKKCLIFT